MATESDLYMYKANALYTTVFKYGKYFIEQYLQISQDICTPQKENGISRHKPFVIDKNTPSSNQQMSTWLTCKLIANGPLYLD